MTIASNTRIFNGTIIQVRNAADDDWIPFTRLIDFNLPGAQANIIDTSTAAGLANRIGLPDVGPGTLNVYDNPDDEFLAEVWTMLQNSEIRTFQIILPEGTLVVKEFTANISMAPVRGTYNGVWTQTITIDVQSEEDWAEAA